MGEIERLVQPSSRLPTTRRASAYADAMDARNDPRGRFVRLELEARRHAPYEETRELCLEARYGHRAWFHSAHPGERWPPSIDELGTT